MNSIAVFSNQTFVFPDKWISVHNPVASAFTKSQEETIKSQKTGHSKPNNVTTLKWLTNSYKITAVFIKLPSQTGVRYKGV